MLLTQIPQDFPVRRHRLMAAHPSAVFVLPAHPHWIRNSDVHHPYRQDSCFYYLTGFDEPKSCVVLVPSQTGSDRMILFVQPKDSEKEIWEGERYGVEGAKKVFQADEAYPIEELGSKLPELFLGAEEVFYRMGFSAEMDQIVLTALESQRSRQGRTGRSLLSVQDPRGPVGELRLYKSLEELIALRRACQISALAHRRVMQEVRPGMREFEVEALVDYICRKEGCQRLGYGSIVANGKNAACLHYHSHRDVLREGELLLMDAGGEYNYYTADITRTFPVGRHFSKVQAQMYDWVLKAQKEAIAMARPGVTLPEIHQRVVEVMIEGFLCLGLLEGSPQEIYKRKQFRRFYPHSTSHWLGMDVHDSGLYMKNGQPRPLEPGMVFTIEPGFYVQPSDFEVPREYQNIGIRIEDDVLITKTGCEILTQGVPKERDEIEQLRA